MRDIPGETGIVGRYVIAVYVDDLLLSGHSDKKIKEMKQALGSQFKMKDMGELRHFLGVQVIQDKNNGSIWIGQSLYTRDLSKVSNGWGKLKDDSSKRWSKTCESDRRI